ncbi:MAG: polyprenyl synthetase family protein, partial [Bryobacteraceae bacterium]
MGFSKLGQSLTAREILDLVQDDLRKVEREIHLESMASVTAVTTISEYLNSNGGKRLRPILLLLASKLISEVNDSAIRMSAVVEIIHTATLVHDDIIDLAETRRGKPSTNVVWGNHTSVLAGDWLYMQAFQIALRERNFHILDLLIGLTQMMVEGELLQLDRIGKIDVTEADYMELVDRKTASLFSA